MFTIAAFSESQTPGSVIKEIAAVPDDTLRTQGDDVIVSELTKLFGCAIFGGSSAEYAYVKTASLLRDNPHYVSPVELALYPAADHHLWMSPGSPLQVVQDEQMNILFYSTAAGAEQGAAIVWFSDQEISSVTAKIMTVRSTITLALTAGTWVSSEINFPDLLQAKDYTIVGARFDIPTAVAARFVPKGGTWRPGALCCNTVEVNEDPHFRHGNLGEWMTFHSLRPPAVEVLGSAVVGSATYNVLIDLIVS